MLARENVELVKMLENAFSACTNFAHVITDLAFDSLVLVASSIGWLPVGLKNIQQEVLVQENSFRARFKFPQARFLDQFVGFFKGKNLVKLSLIPRISVQETLGQSLRIRKAS